MNFLIWLTHENRSLIQEAVLQGGASRCKTLLFTPLLYGIDSHGILLNDNLVFLAFNIPDLDKKATLTPVRPKEGALNRVSCLRPVTLQR